MLAEEMLMHKDAHLQQTNICKYAENKILKSFLQTVSHTCCNVWILRWHQSSASRIHLLSTAPASIQTLHLS